MYTPFFISFCFADFGVIIPVELITLTTLITYIVLGLLSYSFLALFGSFYRGPWSLFISTSSGRDVASVYVSKEGSEHVSRVRKGGSVTTMTFS